MMRSGSPAQYELPVDAILSVENGASVEGGRLRLRLPGWSSAVFVAP